MDIDALVETTECEWLDFKRVHHEDTLSLLHDILCLTNAWAESRRFLVFGVANNGDIIGIEEDQNRRRGAEIQDLLRSSRLNRLPTVAISTHTLNGHEIDVLTIENRPDKPFFLLADKTHRDQTIRAGVVYTRIGDTNCPLRECASEAATELAWRERFGIGLPPLRRAYRLLENPDAWVKVGGETYLYHRDFPEFTVVHGATLNPSFRESWTTVFPDPSAHSYEVELRYGTTVLRRIPYVSCDGGRYSLPLPILVAGGGFEINKNSIAWRIAQLYAQYFPADTALKRGRVSVVDGVEEDA
ncbi:MAG: helix-turn-helix domain-containing protein [Vicinamibacterales bacterium]